MHKIKRQTMKAKLPAIIAAVCCLGVIVSVVAQEPAPPVDHKSNPVIVMGNNSQWTKITGLEAQTLIRVFADGQVHFGRGSDDSAVAGVEGSRVMQYLQGIVGSEWEKELKELVTNPGGHVDKIRNLFGNSGPVNFNQGGVWIKIVKRGTQDLGSAHNTFAVCADHGKFKRWTTRGFRI